jgi:hypothetical protein
MQAILKNLLSELHTLYFKPNGFTKKRHRFSRQVDSVMQEIEFQSSQWNSAGEPVGFYVNIHCGFADILMRDGKPALTGTGRIEGLAPGAHAMFDLTRPNFAAIRDQLIPLLATAMRELPEHYEDIRTRAQQGWHTPVPLPATWRV